MYPTLQSAQPVPTMNVNMNVNMAGIPGSYRLTCHAKKLEAKDGLHVAALGSSSDPYVKIIGMNNQIAGKSNVETKSLNPKWKPFEVDTLACGGLDCPIMLQVYDWDKDGKDDFIGETRTSLRELTTRIGQPFELINMKKRGRAFYKNSGYFYVDFVEALAVNTKHAKVFHFEMSAKGLDIKDFISSDPFLVIYGCPKVYNAFGMAYGVNGLKPYTKLPKNGKKSKYSGIAGQPVVIYMSKPIMSNLNPKWEPFTLESRLMGGPNGNIRIEVWDWDKSGQHDFIGAADVNVRDILVEGAMIPLINPSRKSEGLYRNSGVLHVNVARPALDVQPVNELTCHSVRVRFAGEKLASRDLFSKSDPFMTIKNTAGNIIYRSEEYMNERNPEFKEVILSTINCGGLDGSFQLLCGIGIAVANMMLLVK